MEILGKLSEPAVWQEFVQYKVEKQHLANTEQEKLREYMEKQKYIPLLNATLQPDYVPPIPVKKEINKSGVSKKRIVYSFPPDFNMLLKIIAFSLYKYDSLFPKNCYAFRQNYGVGDAIRRIRHTKAVSQKYCLKVDIRNYFNSIHVPMLLEKLAFLKEEDGALFLLFEKLLCADKSIVKREKGKQEASRQDTQADKTGEEEVIIEKRGAMAGTPISPFFANVYLMDVDQYFEKRGVLYFRYSDDILLFADTLKELENLQEQLYEKIEEHHLSLNPSKVQVSHPGEAWEFLGFCYQDGKVDLSEQTKRKIKGKIKRKAHALRRWQMKKGLSGEKAAKGFIHAMNHKFYDGGEGTDFCWSRWFFPNLTTDAGLKEIDAYMQQYIRFCVTGRHYKGNYRITYDRMKEWGYRSLVHEYYSYVSCPCKEDVTCNKSRS